MAVFRRRAHFLRDRKGHEHGRVTFVELFFDLVFVFAVTQLSHSLIEHFTPWGAAQTVLLLMAVWWVWIYTSWITNWLDPERTPVRLALLVLMLAGLVLSTSIPKAFDARGLTFAAAYVAMQVGRTAFMLWALGDGNRPLVRNFQRILAWLVLSGLFWIVGGLAEGPTRFTLWALALVLEYASPSVGFWTPGLGRSTTGDWNVEGAHLAERCALFIIIALGESIIVTGTTFSNLDWTSTAVAAFVTAFIGSVAMWWIYFDTGAKAGSENIAAAEDPGRLARLAYTYLHLPIVAGVILSAVADELVLAHPGGHVDAKTAIAVIGGPLVFLVGTVLFKRAVTGWFRLSHLVGIGLLVALAPLSLVASPLLFAIAATLVLMLVAAWETISLRPSAAS